MADLPIDIHYQKLTEWLLSRNKIKKKWQQSLPALKAKTETLRLRLPDDLDLPVATDGSTPLHYYHCKAIFEQLKERASDVSKSWFGGYKDEQLADWSSVLRDYEKNNVYLGEAARILERNTTYEAPFMKNTLARNEKELKDLLKKETSNLAGIESNRLAYTQELAAYGIETNEYQSDELLKRQLRGTSKVLAEKLNHILEALKSEQTLQAIEYHQAFVKHVNGTEIDGDLLETLALVREKAEPLDPETIGGPSATNEAADGDAGIDLDWNIELSTSGEGDIEWDISVDPEPQEDHTETPANPPQLDSTSKPGMEVQGMINLLDKDVRRDLQNDLLELSAFVLQRKAEMTSLESEGLSSLLSGLEEEHAILKQQSVASISSFHDTIDALLSTLGDEKLQELILTQQGEIYFERLVERFKQKAHRIAKLQVSINQIASKREQIIQENQRLRADKQRLVQETKALKAAVERTLSAQYKGRQVNIIGDINFI